MLKRVVFALSLCVMCSFSVVRSYSVGMRSLNRNSARSINSILAVKQENSRVSQMASWPMFCHDNMRTGYTDDIPPKTNKTLWTYPHEGAWIVTSPVVGDGMVFIGDEYLDLHTDPNPHIYALDETSGELLWNFSFSGLPWTPAVSDGRLFFGTTQGFMYSLEAPNGTVIWSKELGDPVESSPAISEGSIYVGTLGGKIFALNWTDGEVIWQQEIGYEYALSPALAYDTIFIDVMTHPTAYLCALDKATGSLKWSFNYTRSFGLPRWWQQVPLTSPVVSDGKVYTGADGFYCLNATSGDMIWKNTTIYIWSSPSAHDGKVFFGGSTGWHDKQCFYAFSQDTGELIWKHEFDDMNDVIFSSPAIAGGIVFMASHGAMYGSKRSYVYALNETNGHQVWSYDTADEETMTSPAVSDGKVFLTTPHYLLVFGDNTPPSISVPSRQPETVMPNQNVTVSVNVTDAETGVKNVTLLFNVNNGTTWEEPAPMIYNLSTKLYDATIPGHQAGTWVKFKIIAYDNHENKAIKDDPDQYCSYQVIPEYPSFIMWALFMTATLLSVIVCRRKYTGKQFIIS